MIPEIDISCIRKASQSQELSDINRACDILKEHIINRTISPRDAIQYGFPLAAVKYDISGSSPELPGNKVGYVESLEKVLKLYDDCRQNNENPIATAYQQGYAGGTPLSNPDAHYQPIVALSQKIAKTTEAQLVHYPFCARLMGLDNKASQNKNSFPAFNRSLDEAITNTNTDNATANQVRTLTWLYLLSDQADNYIYTRVTNTLNSVPFLMGDTTPYDYWIKEFAGSNDQTKKAGIAFCHGYRDRLVAEQESLIEKIHEIEDPDDIAYPHMLWNAVVCMNIPPQSAVAHDDRVPIFEALLNQNWDQAKEELQKQASRQARPIRPKFFVLHIPR